MNRRQVIAGLAAAVPIAGRPFSMLKQAGALGIEMPEGACDAHVHIIADLKRYPMAADRDYTPAPATATSLAEMMQSHHLSRTVIVAAEVYGDDNDATLDAVRQLGLDRARGIAWLPKDRSVSGLKALKAAGIAGFRVLLDTSGKTSDKVLNAQFQHLLDNAVR